MELNHNLSYSIKAMFERKHFDTIESTHKWALAQEADPLALPLLVTADRQTGSIGRRKGTCWIAAPKTSLLATFFLPNFPSHQAHNLAQLLTCSIVSVLKKQNISPLFKWPNDLMLSHKKLGGAMGDIKENAAIISCALNINNTSEDLEKVDIPATSLLIEYHKLFSIEKITDLLALQFADDILTLTEKGFSSFAKIMNQALAFKNQIVQINDATISSGVVKEITDDGRLIVRNNGKDLLLSTGSLHLNY